MYALTASESVLDFIGSARIAFLSYSYITNMYLFPLLDVIGNRPVRSVYIFHPVPLLWHILHYTVEVRCRLVRNPR
jgi:hypothetical protein